jgi:endonuclease-3
MAELVELPGVARKTANVVLGTAYGIAAGVVVDTHVGRVAGRLGMSQASNAVAVERDLMELIPREDWIWFAHALIWHGRRVCGARNPDCGACTLAGHCPSSSA